VVSGKLNLAYTTQLLPIDDEMRIVPREGGTPASRTEAQMTRVLDRLESTFKEAGTGLDRLVKVNVYAAQLEVVPAVRAALAKRIAGRAQPAVSVVVGELTSPEAVVAADAIAATSEAPKVGRGFAILAAGSRVWVSGQAAPDPDLSQATRK